MDSGCLEITANGVVDDHISNVDLRININQNYVVSIEGALHFSCTEPCDVHIGIYNRGEIKDFSGGEEIDILFNYGVISGGTYDCFVNSSGTISGGDFRKDYVYNYGELKGGYFSNRYVLNHGNISGGTFDSVESIDNNETISGGDFRNTSITSCSGNVSGGIFKESDKNTIPAGSSCLFYDEATKTYTVRGEVTLDDTFELKEDEKLVIPNGAKVNNLEELKLSGNIKGDVIETHIHDDMEFKPISNGRLTDGNYYYNSSVHSLSIQGNVNLCLNGQEIFLGEFDISDNSTLSIYNDDVEGEGSIPINVYGGQFDNSNTLNIYSGTLEPEVSIIGQGTINLIGGKIEPEYDAVKLTGGKLYISGGICENIRYNLSVDGLNDSPAELYLSGNPKISAITVGSLSTIKIDKQLDPAFKCNISVENGGTGVFAELTEESYANESNFTAPEGYTIVKNGKKLYLTNQETHSHEDGKVFTPWFDNENLPTKSGSYYLVNEVTLPDDWNVPTDGEVNLCLNRKTISVGSHVINVGSGAKLNIYDEEGNNGSITGSGTYGTININSGDLTVNGGTITTTGNYAIVGSTNTIKITGDPIISGTKASIWLSSEMIIDIDGELKNTDPYVIDMDTPGVFATGGNAAAYANKFKPAKELEERGYSVKVTADGELAITLKTYTITYDQGTDGTGTIDPTIKTHSEPTTLSSDKFTRPGYTQVGWTTKDDGETIDTTADGKFEKAYGQYTLGDEFTENKDITFYPIWMKNSIALSLRELNIKVHEKARITANVSPKTAVYDSVTWSVAKDNGVIEFTESDGGKTVDITALKEGTVTLTASADGGATTAECKINVTRTDSTVTPLADETITYGDELTLSAEVNKISAISLMSAGLNEVEFFNGEKSLGIAKVEGDTATLTVKVTKDKFSIGEHKIKAVYGGSISLNGSESSEIIVNVKKRTLMPSISGTTFEKVYDGNDSADGLGLSIALDNVVSGDNVTANGKFTFDSVNVKDAKTITADNITLDGNDAEYYTLSATSLTHGGEIKPVKVEIPEKTFTYDGKTVRKVIIDGVNNETVTATLTPYSKNAGTYTYDVITSPGKYTVGLSSTNYEISTDETLTIKQLTAEIEWQKETSFVYDGTEKSITAKVTNAIGGDTFNIVYENNTGKDVGKYTARITSLGNDNYKLDGNTALEWKISAAGSENVNATINYTKETISTNSKMEYSLDGEKYFPCTENMSVTEFGWDGSESITVMFRYAADQNHSAGAAQTVVIPTRPAAPDISKVTKTQNSITVTEIAGCEYSIDGTTWQGSGKFAGLKENTEYTVQIRTKATANAFASFAAEKRIVTSVTASGTTELKTGETVETDSGSITNDGKTVEMESKDGNKTTVTLPDGNYGEVTVDESGNVNVPDGSVIQTGDTVVTLPDGGKVSTDGTITAGKVVIGDTTVSGDEVTVTPDGNITVYGNGKVQDGDTIVTGETVTVDEDGNIAIPDGGIVHSANGSETVIGKDGSIKNNEVSIEPVDSMGYFDENGENYSLNNGYIVLDIESADNDKLVKDLESGSGISVIKAYDIRLLYNGKFEVQPNGTVKVTIAAPASVDGTEKVLHVNENGFEDMNAKYDRNSKTFSFETNHFSIYVIARAETSDDSITPPSIPQTVPNKPSPAPAETEKTDNSDDEEDVSSGAKIVSAGEKICGDDGLQNVCAYLLVFSIAAIAIIAKRKRQK